MQSFRAYLQSSERVLTLLGAGLSASSGLPTFRGAGGLWRNHEATSLATPGAFRRDPGLVWQFYAYRRHGALQAQPNAAHLALAEFTRRTECVTLSQNVDGLSPRAGHPPLYLHLLHGSLFDLRCSSASCDYVDRDNFTDPLVPALDMSRRGDITKHNTPLESVDPADLPQCPRCQSLLRPGVVWFGESLPSATMSAVQQWMDAAPRIDLMLVVGTSAQVYPAAGYIGLAQAKGAKVAVVNMDPDRGDLEADWYFRGDAAEWLPEMLKA